MTIKYCPVCSEEFIEQAYSGNFLIVEEFPQLCLPERKITAWERNNWSPRSVLQNELHKIGMTIHQFTLISAYPHRHSSENPREQCYNIGLDYIKSQTPLFYGCIFLGGNLCKQITGYDLKDVMGLSNVPSLSGWDIKFPVFFPSIGEIQTHYAREFSIGLHRWAEQVWTKSEIKR